MRLLSAQTKNKGFTLLELTMVLVIGGLIVTPFLHLYTVNKKREQLETTKKEEFAVQYALQAYMKTNKRFPCPADPSIAMTASGWQKEVNCAAGATPPAGVKSTIGRNNQEIWIGSVPLSALNLAGDLATDSWGGRYTYAVTRPLTLPNAITDVNNPPDGAISVIDEFGANILNTADTARFMITSHGINKIGGYTSAGVRTGCTAPAQTTPTTDPNSPRISDDENCNDDKTFVISAVYEGSGIRSDDFTISDMTQNVAPDDSPISKVLVCNAKMMFYVPNSTNPVPDVDGCVLPPNTNTQEIAQLKTKVETISTTVQSISDCSYAGFSYSPYASNVYFSPGGSGASPGGAWAVLPTMQNGTGFIEAMAAVGAVNTGGNVAAEPILNYMKSHKCIVSTPGAIYNMPENY